MRHCLSSTARQSGCFQGCPSEGSATHSRLLPPRTPLPKILAQCRASSQTEREKGSYFEELIRTYFRYEASYADLYLDVWLFADCAKAIGTPEFGISAKDTGIDLVAKTRGTEESTGRGNHDHEEQ